MMGLSQQSAILALFYYCWTSTPVEAFVPSVTRQRQSIGSCTTTTTTPIDTCHTSFTTAATRPILWGLQATVAPDSASSSSPSRNQTQTSSSLPANNNNNKKQRFRPKSRQSSSSVRSFKDIYVLNEAINKLAEQAGDSRQPVIKRAAAAEALWKEFSLEDQQSDNNNNNINNEPTIHADSVSFNTVLKAWGKAAQVLSEHHNDRNHEHLLDANIPIYTSRECAQHALDLLNEREELLSNDENVAASNLVPPLDINAYNTVMDAWAKTMSGAMNRNHNHNHNSNNNHDEPIHEPAIAQVEAILLRVQKSSNVEADVRSYNALVDAHAHSQSPDKLDTLDRIVQHMRSTPHLNPTSRTLNSLLHAYSLHMKDVSNPNHRSGGPMHYKKKEELARRAQRHFKQLQKQYQESSNIECLPDAITYTTMMDVWSRVGSVQATHEAEALLKELKEQADSTTTTSSGTNQRPNAYSYTVLMSSWSRCAVRDESAPRRVEELLEEMIQDPTITLGSRPFTAALLCYSKSPTLTGKAVKALNTLKRIKELAKQQSSDQLKPNLQCYHAALECCAKTNDADLRQHTVALKIAFAILQSMKLDGIEPTNVTYSKLFKAVEVLLPAGAERNKVAVAAWQQAKQAAVADVVVVKAFQKAADVQVVLAQMPELADRNGYVDYSSIPLSWRKNVVGR
eukprot:CAMPEP_0168749614 /NCGR_PEP_ID=MMETSP0724-20121128/16811_1 /TAXON_ID=265536 /ORGANISM="Amphiprora sp., Strain CCMP467" /LENGTH=681 /DNA_ID=CAMNT_0008797537 /DNA_START=58 /DNA_END=2103 /DNA_ORIENTATION=+